MSHGVSRSDRITSLRVLNQCIAEYRAWEACYSRNALDSLRWDTLGTLASPSIPGLTGASGPHSDLGEFVVYDFQGDSEEYLEPTDVYVKEGVLPHPAYAICTPAARNIKVGDDPDLMPFVPFADDPAFNFEPYNHEYGYFAWQQARPDPALEIIAIEALQRLMTQGIDTTTVDEMGLFPNRLRPSSAPAFAWLGRLLNRRDFPDTLPLGWSHILRGVPAYHNAGPSSLLSSLLDTFCHNPNCLTGYCFVHLGKIPPPLTQKPSISSVSLAASADKACGHECFLTSGHQHDTKFAETPWSDSDKELLKTVLGHTPDALPCDLAVICRKPCSEVFQYIAQHFEASRPPRKRTAERRLTFKDHNAELFKPKKPCSHSGPCDSTSRCKCFENEAHCTPNCRCDRQCTNQWKGCQCGSKPGQICRTKHCPCRLALRECDPRVCRGCSVSRILAANSEEGSQRSRGTVCCNMEIQLGLPKRTEVRRSRWGLGLFIMEDTRKGDFILEYTGELIHDDTTESRGHIARHHGRSYIYNLNRRLSVDSSTVGNEARYINHDSDATHVNCHATIRTVLGEHRIGIFATKFIAAGREILIDYGSGFFKDTPTEDGQRNSSSIATHATPRQKGLGVGKIVERPIKEEDMSDSSYQPSVSHSRSASGSQGSTSRDS